MLSHDSALHTTHSTLNCHPPCPLGKTAVSLHEAALAYLHSRKPEVPSGPVGWRITWLFERTGSSVCCTLIQAGLNGNRKKLNGLQNTFRCPSQNLSNFFFFGSLLFLRHLTCPGTDCPEAFLLKKHYPKSFVGPLRTLPPAGPETSSAERDGTRLRGFPRCRYW